MGSFDQVDLALLAICTFVAVIVLVRLMRARRDQLLSEFRDGMQLERERKLAEEKRQQQAAKKVERKVS